MIPADMPMRLKTNTASNNGLNVDYSIASSVRRITSGVRGLPRHTSRANILYLDGHVKSSQPFPIYGSFTPTALDGVLPYGTAIRPDANCKNFTDTTWQDF